MAFPYDQQVVDVQELDRLRLEMVRTNDPVDHRRYWDALYTYELEAKVHALMPREGGDALSVEGSWGD